jgi:phosphoglycerate dehydrogenase-like enzyme
MFTTVTRFQLYFYYFALTGDKLVERLAPFDILCVMRERTPFPKELIERLPNLKLLITSGPTNVLLTLLYLHNFLHV